jgi:enoyl-CoA hydratase/carnithine racemase
MSAPNKLTQMNAPVAPVQIRLVRRSPAYWRVTIDNPPINVMGPVMVKRFQEVMAALGADEQVRVLVFDSVVDDYFLNHFDFTAKLEDLTGMPEGPTGLPPWPDLLARLTRLPVASIALIRGPATSNGSEITLACDLSFASREKTIISQWEVGVGMVAGGNPMARLPRLIGRNRALEVLSSSEDIRADQAEAYRCINRALPTPSWMRSLKRSRPGSPSSTNGRSLRSSVWSTPACRRTSSSVPGGMRASLRSGDLPPRRGSRR